MDAERDIIQITSFVAVLFGLFMPAIETVHGTRGAPETHRRLRVGELATIGITGLVGLYIGGRSGNYRPMFMGVMVAFLIVGMYEYIYRMSPVGESE